ncbi:23S rRNA (pseudouridine(1915)-N(3))-methyltransferase RlmH [Phosphitispora fastidiosa]|uniref:23S rRNA (pseudouridine(1915)-N(3))-methyltransferase RlmH n=1 Tax=Phosphitispora fastidiosa TaxID=2837202 RepID=UPI001E3D01B0|nr:23S rRNA (pseudouridine(1915)-N(3))-methyltransferase RlmH [Phosphitispora fastidiosa]MBU7007274.1 23S rRNA (pseudouridine1915-N3)-methyltransferase [Phosphitispora fastidiosa]
MNIQIFAIGKVKEKYISDGLQEYLKRMRPYACVEVKEVPDDKVPEGLSAREAEQVKAREGERILKLLKPGQVVIALDSRGSMISSEQLAEEISGWGLAGKSDLAFIIGGSLGLHSEVIGRADLVLSFGKMTFPHQLMRLILLEQIYRAFKINRGEPYHK